MEAIETSRDFWTGRSEYPSYRFVKRRRLHEVGHIARRLHDMETVKRFCDVGCGDGALVRCLDQVLEVESFFCCDLSEGLLSKVPSDGRHKKVVVDLNDRAQHALIEPGDVVNLGGCLNYVFDDETAEHLLRSLEFKRMFIRNVCSESDELVDAHSERLGTRYSCLYRSQKRMEEIISRAGLKTKESFRAYPDEIESEFGTKQYMFYIVR